MEGSTSQSCPAGHARSASGTSANSLGAAPSRSISMNSISSDCSSESPLVEEEDIIVLTHDVKNFKEALGRLRKIFNKDKEKQETTRVSAHERLGEVLRILRSILEKYSALQSTELLVAAGTLIQQVKGYNYEDDKSDPAEFFEAIDQLALAFSSRVSEYLMGDLDSSSCPVIKTRSCDNIGDESDPFATDAAAADLTPQEIDNCLIQHDHGVNLGLQRAKAWSKYAKDVMVYIEKRCHLDMEHAKGIAKIAQTMRPILKEESFLPFQSIYCTALDQDIDNANNTTATCSLIQGVKFIDQLSNRRSEHEKARKEIKETWQRELKKMHEAVSNMKKAKASYFQRQQEYEKAKESALKAEATEGTEASKLEKKRRFEEDAFQKAMEAETTYKACIVEANERQMNLEKVKADVLRQVRELMYRCDQTMKAVTAGYFQLQYTMSAPLPVQYQTLCESSKLYEPGKQYMEFVKRQAIPHRSMHKVIQYSFEPYSAENRSDKDRRYNEPADEEVLRNQALEARLTAENKEKKPPVKAWNPSVKAIGSDSDSVSSCPSNKSQDTSPAASPHISGRKILIVSSGDELEIDHDAADGIYNSYNKLAPMSKAAETHTFRRLKTPSRCRECDSIFYIQGVECSECGLPCHKKCLEALALQCGHKRLPHKMTTFGVELTAHAEQLGGRIPYIVTKCVTAVENKGLFVKGIYRVSGVKSRVEKLCQSFENGAELVDLTDVHPNVIASVLKLYLRQLPEPLLTFRHYPDFISIAKNYPSLKEDVAQTEKAVKELKALVKQLPDIHYTTLAYLMHHLKRVSEQAEHNNMPPSNLGIVFGPTLLRTSEGTASLSSLVDTVHQTRIVELLVRFVSEIFGDSGEYEKQEYNFTEENERASRLVNRTLSSTSHASDTDVLDGSSRSDQHYSSKMDKNSFTYQDFGDYTPSSDDLLGSSVISDDDFPDIMLPDDSATGRSPLLPLQTNIKETDSFTSLHRKDVHTNIESRTSHTSSPAISETSHSSTVQKYLVEESTVSSDIGFDTRVHNEPPIPPPRKHLLQTVEKKLDQSTSSTEDSGINSQEETSQASSALSPGARTSTSALTAELRRQFFESPPRVAEVAFVSHSSSSDSKTSSEEVFKPSYHASVSHSTPKYAELVSSSGDKESLRERVSEDTQGSAGSNIYSSPLSESITSLSHRYISSLSSPYSGKSVHSAVATSQGIGARKISSGLSHYPTQSEEIVSKRIGSGEMEYSSQQSSLTKSHSSESQFSSHQYVTTRLFTDITSGVTERTSCVQESRHTSTNVVTQSSSETSTSGQTFDSQENQNFKASERLPPNRQPRFV